MMKHLNEFRSDLKKQLIILMGLPASGKSTFIKTELKKYFPQSAGFSVSNSDNQLVRFQYLTACSHLDNIKKNINTETDLFKFKEKTKFASNDGNLVKLNIQFSDIEEIKTLKNGEYFKKFYKGFYAIFFDVREIASQENKKLFKEKIWTGNDVIVIDTTGVNTVSVFEKMKELDEHDYNIR